jgi:hypothetical protein
MRPLQFAADIGPRGPSAERIGETNVRVPKMPFQKTRTVADPMKSDAVERLTSHVKPPV